MDANLPAVFEALRGLNAPISHYKYVKGLFSYYEAQAGAAAQGGHLATITSAAENAFLAGLIAGQDLGAWLGGSDVRRRGRLAMDRRSGGRNDVLDRPERRRRPGRARYAELERRRAERHLERDRGRSLPHDGQQRQVERHLGAVEPRWATSSRSRAPTARRRRRPPTRPPVITSNGGGGVGGDQRRGERPAP